MTGPAELRRLLGRLAADRALEAIETGDEAGARRAAAMVVALDGLDRSPRGEEQPAPWWHSPRLTELERGAIQATFDRLRSLEAGQREDRRGLREVTSELWTLRRRREAEIEEIQELAAELADAYPEAAGPLGLVGARALELLLAEGTPEEAAGS